MSKRVKLTVKDDEEDVELRNLLEKYMKRSEELEMKENTILKQMEIVQAAVASLKDWNESRKASTSDAPDSVHIDPLEFEEETKQIRKETERIEEEIRKKIIENRLLQEEVSRQKMCEVAKLEKHKDKSRLVEEIECRASPELESEPSIGFFRSKLKKLKEMQKLLSLESRQEVEETKRKKKELNKKIDRLEMQFEEDQNQLKSGKSHT